MTSEQLRLFTVAEISLKYSTKVKASDRPKIAGSQDADEQFRIVWNHQEMELRESFKAMYLNRSNRVLGISTISEGGLSGTVVDVRLILATALKAGASSIILCHNHPSGNLKPSEADYVITNKIRDAGKVMDIQVLDHLILTDDSYFSFSDEGLM